MNHLERIDANKLVGARSYFTNFDRHITKKIKDKSLFKRQIERTLKILLLTKNTVVSGASVMMSSEFVVDFFREHPILLEEDMVIPALRKDKKGFRDYINRLPYSSDKINQLDQFYSSKISKIISWELKENSNWFKEKFIKGFIENGSVIRSNLSTLSGRQLDYILNTIQQKETLNKDFIEDILNSFPKNEANIIRNYRNLLYHMSGARVVNCESTLPQENYIDFSLADMENEKTILSELQIFWKIFLEVFFETFNKPKLPVELLDLLSFSDIQKIRAPLLESGFIANYNRLIDQCVNTVRENQPEKILLNIDELLTIKSNLNSCFQEIFDKELNQLMKRKKISKVSLIKNNFNIGLGFSPEKLISGSIAAPETPVSMLFNSAQLFYNYRILEHYDNAFAFKVKYLQDSIEASDFDKKTSLIKVIKLLFNSINSKSIA